MDMGRCTGMMEVFIKVIGTMEFNMVRVKFMSQAKVIKKEYSKIII